MLRPGVRLFHIRHGETDWNVEGRLQGRRDVPINARGRAQAARNGAVLAERLAAEGLDPGALDWIVSPLGRARETMAIVRGSMKLDPDAFRIEPLLLEVDFGDWAGFTYPELSRTESGRLMVRARKRDKWSFVPPKGESYADMSARVAGWLDTIRRDTVVVSHGGIYRVLNGLVVGVPDAEVPRLVAPQDRVAMFRNGTLTLF